MTDLPTWLEDLRLEVEAHPCVNHEILGSLESRDDYARFGLQHLPLVSHFTRYMELLLLRAPSSEQKLWLAKVLVDEYGEGSEGLDHARLYREFLASVGVVDDARLESTPLLREVWQFIGVHLELCGRAPFLVGLGALGPGHEWAIPKMFGPLIAGLERLGVTYEQRRYFDLHTEQDVDHAAWMSEALEQLGTSEAARDEVRRGARLSLGARQRLWDAAQRTLHGSPGEYGGDLHALRAASEAALSGGRWPVVLPSEADLLAGCSLV